MATSILKTNRPGVRNAAAMLIFAAVIFGGASRLDVLAPIVPRIAAVVALAWLIWTTPPRALTIGWPQAILLAGLIAIPLAQLIPLPWSIWSDLPGREHSRQLFELLGSKPWQAMSLTPSRTVNALLALLPAIAAYLIGARLDADGRGGLVAMLALLALASAVLGLLQFAAGPESVLYFYAITNGDASVGFFSNANHHSLFLCVGIVATFVWLGSAMRERAKVSLGSSVAVLAVIATLLMSIAATQSRAGAGLSIFALLGGALLLPLKRVGVRARARALFIGVPVAALTLTIVLAFQGAFGERLMIETGPNDRIDYLPLFVKIISDHFPIGSGLGSFDPVFRGYEHVDWLVYNYLNNAHNDYAQIAIETGLAGSVLLIGFFGWFAILAVRVWRHPDGSERVARQQRAATIVIALLLAHSAVDYPLRTASLSVVFAFACALLTAPGGARRRLEEPRGSVPS